VGFFDRLFGRGKQTAGEVADDESMQREGAHQELKGQAEDRADEADQAAQDAREDAAKQSAQQDAEAES
jgi:uncharacterized protein YjbJ (UPF0337 family)